MNRTPTVIHAHTGHINAVLFSADSRTLLSAGMDNVVKLWSVGAWQLLGACEGHTKSVNAMSFSPTNEILATASSDETVRLWAYPEGRQIRTLAASGSYVKFAPDGRHIFTAHRNKGRLFSFPEEDELVTITAHEKKLHSASFSPDGRVLATAGLEHEVYLWEMPLGNPLARLSGHTDVVRSVAFSHDGSFLASTGHEGALRLWSTADWALLGSTQLPGPGVGAIALAPDDGTIAISIDHSVVLVSAESHEIVDTLPVKAKGVYQGAYSPDGRWLAVAAADKRVRIWDVL